MWAAIVGALGRVAGWFLGAGTMKWALFAFLWFAVAQLFAIVLDLLPSWVSADALNANTSAFTPALWFFIDYFKVQDGISLVLGAAVVRFLIRRIPFIG